MSFHTIDGGRGNLPSLCVEIDVTNLPTNPTRVWTDITTDVRQLSYVRAGRNDELQRTQPGSLSMVLDNRTATYDPTNLSGIGIKRAQWVRVRAQWAGVTYPRWQGIITTIDLSWPDSGKDGTATVTAADAMKILNLYDLSGATFVSQASDQRVAAVCTAAGAAYTLADAGATTLVAVTTPFSEGSLASQHLEDVEQTENGLIFADGSGSIVFQSRHYRILNSATAADTIGDNTGEIPYRNADVVSDDAYIYTAVEVTPTNSDGSLGTPQTSTATTAGTYFTRNYRRTILSSDTNEAQSCADFLTGRYGDPSPRVPAVELIGVSATSKWPSILSATNSQRLTFKRRAPNVFSEDVFVEQVSDAVLPGQNWSVTLQLSPATDQAGWVVGDSTYSVLGSTTRVVY